MTTIQEGNISSFPSNKTSFLSLKNQRQVVIEGKIYDLFNGKLQPQGQTPLDKTEKKQFAYLPLKKVPADDIYLLYGRGNVRAQQEQARLEERIRNIGDVPAPSLKGYQTVLNNEDVERKLQIEEAIVKAQGTNDPPPVYTGEAFKRSDFDRRRQQKRGQYLKSVVKQKEPEQPSAPPSTRRNSISEPPQAKKTKIDIKEADGKKEKPNPAGLTSLKRKNLEKIPEAKKIKTQGTKRKGTGAPVVKKKVKYTSTKKVAGKKRRAGDQGGAVAKKQMLRLPLVAGEKRKAPAQLGGAKKKRNVMQTDEFGLPVPAPVAVKRKAKVQLTGVTKKQKIADEKITRLAGGKTLRRLKAVNYSGM